MAFKFQRRRSDLGFNRPSVNSLYSQLTVGLDDDQRIVFPEMYIEHPELYDDIIGVAYLVKGDHPDSRLDWVWERAIPDLLKRSPKTKILAKQLIVRLRLPWNEVDTEWTCSRKELEDVREDVDILEVFIYAEDRLRPGRTRLIDPLDFQTNRDRYDVKDIRYCVAWKMSEKSMKELLGIPERYLS